MRTWLLLACVLLVARSSALSASAVVDDVYGPSNAGAGASAPRTLVLVDTYATSSTHSRVLAALRARGHTVDVALASEKNHLRRFDVWQYENLLVLAPETKNFGGSISVAEVLEFADSGRNVLVAAESSATAATARLAGTSGFVRSLFAEFGATLHGKRTAVIDHVHFVDGGDAAEGVDHTLVYTSRVSSNSVVLGAAAQGAAKDAAPVVFQGHGMTFNEKNPWLFPVVTGERTSYSYKPLADEVSEYPASAGTDTVMVAGLQTHTNGRVVLTGSLRFLSDAFFTRSVATASKKYKQSRNEQLVGELLRWNFGERGVLRVRDVVHRVAGTDKVNPTQVRIKDDAEVEMVIEEFDGNSKQWVAFTRDDVQYEYYLVDPFVRQMLSHDGAGRYSAAFRIPDQFGVYKLRVDYLRPGYSYLFFERVVPAHPYHHDEHPRFVSTAFPYYASVFSLMVAFFLFGIVFLYQKEQ